MAFLTKRNGRWYIYWQQNGKKRGRSLRTDQKALADAYLKEFEYKLTKRELGQAMDVALGRLLEDYLSYSRSTKARSTYEGNDLPRASRFVNYLKSRGLEKASQITQAHVQDFQQQLTAELSPRSVRHCMFAASGLMSFALSRGYVSSNVVRGVQKIKAEKNPPRYLSFDEWEQVKEVARQIHLWPLVATAYYTGFRNSELRFLTWSEIDFDCNVITLVNKEGFTLKNRQSRTVPLHKDLKEVLLPLKKARGYCFLDSHGHQFDARELSVAFRKLVVRPSKLQHFSLHTLRHTFASHLVMKGMDIYRVSQWLGHRSVSTTMIYAHLAPQDDKINVL